MERSAILESDPEICWPDTAKVRKCLTTLLGEGGSDPGSCPYFDAEDYHQYIDDSVDGIQNQTAAAGTATYTQYHGPPLMEYLAPTVGKIAAFVMAPPNKSCPANPLPIWLLKESIEVLTPFLEVLMATSLATGKVPRPGSTLSFEVEICGLARSCHYQLWRIKSIRYYVTTRLPFQLIRALRF